MNDERRCQWCGHSVGALAPCDDTWLCFDCLRGPLYRLDCVAEDGGIELECTRRYDGHLAWEEDEAA